MTDRGDPDDCSAAPCDAPESSSIATVTIAVAPVNDAPTATDTSLTTGEDTPLAVDLATLVSDLETADADLLYEIVDAPSNGDVTGSGGSRTYTPDANFNGLDSFTYRVADRGDPDDCSAAPCDGPEISETKTVSITVDPVNDAPVNTLPAGPLNATQNTDTPVAGISIADVDAGTDAIELQLSVAHGTLTLDPTLLGGIGTLDIAGNGTSSVAIVATLAQINTTLAAANGLVYHGDAPYTGPDELAVDTSDAGHNGAGGPLSDSDTLAISVNPPNAAPVAAAQSVSTERGHAEDHRAVGERRRRRRPPDLRGRLRPGTRLARRDRHGHVRPRDTEHLHRRRHLHARRRLLRAGQLHVHGQRRHRELRAGDGLDHGRPGQRRSEAAGHGGRRALLHRERPGDRHHGDDDGGGRFARPRHRHPDGRLHGRRRHRGRPARDPQPGHRARGDRRVRRHA